MVNIVVASLNQEINKLDFYAKRNQPLINVYTQGGEICGNIYQRESTKN
jgi:hypothetical protein